MNSWESLWPDRQIGWPRHADPAAVLLHLTPALLLIALTETIAAYRRTVTDLLDRTDPAEHPASAPTVTTRSPKDHADPNTTEPDPLNAPPLVDRCDSEPHSACHSPTTTEIGYNSPRTVNDMPDRRPLAPDHRPAGDRAANADVWARAVALDAAVRAAMGTVVSIWRLRTDLRIGATARPPDPRPAPGPTPRPTILTPL
ncbi:hypothetical protein [Streptomyces sp. NBC_00872]|uniref:hypothetical protein n=1 Tax=Streptomyces sp. NBC_00872 TaxID=2903686 RepID=UPI00386ABF08|nr:hypothetical protein OG214_07625 [Streptomyces sp. NBC_00872]